MPDRPTLSAAGHASRPDSGDPTDRLSRAVSPPPGWVGAADRPTLSEAACGREVYTCLSTSLTPQPESEHVLTRGMSSAARDMAAIAEAPRCASVKCRAKKVCTSPARAPYLPDLESAPNDATHAA